MQAAVAEAKRRESESKEALGSAHASGQDLQRRLCKREEHLQVIICPSVQTRPSS